jgi:hypothetical protein
MYILKLTRTITMTNLKTKKAIYTHELEIDQVTKDPKCRGGEIENIQIGLTLGQDIFITQHQNALLPKISETDFQL